MRKCDFCERPIVDDDGSKIVNEPHVPLLAHVKCWEEHQKNVSEEFQNKIALVNDIGDLKQLINNLPNSMRVRLKRDNNREITPTIGVEKSKEGGYVLEIRP